MSATSGARCPTLAVSGSNLSGDVPFSAALRLSDGEIHVRCSPVGERGDLATLCDELCRQHGLRPDQIEQLLVDVGPGSYTGLRVAITFVRFLQAFGPVEVEAACSLALLASRGVATGTDARIRVLLDARRGRYHTALYEVDAGQLVEREPPAAVVTEQALGRIAVGDIVVLPAQLAERLEQQLQDRCQLIVARQVTAAELFTAPTVQATAEDLEPRYLMASYAEE